MVFYVKGIYFFFIAVAVIVLLGNNSGLIGHKGFGTLALMVGQPEELKVLHHFGTECDIRVSIPVAAGIIFGIPFGSMLPVVLAIQGHIVLHHDLKRP